MTPPDIYYKRSRFSTRLPWDRLYTASHFWVLEAEPGRWRVGLTKFAARMLGDIVDLEFEVPDGGAVGVGEVIGSLEGFKARTELYCGPPAARSSAATRPWRRHSTCSTPTATAPAGSTRSRAPPTPGPSTPAATRRPGRHHRQDARPSVAVSQVARSTLRARPEQVAVNPRAPGERSPSDPVGTGPPRSRGFRLGGPWPMGHDASRDPFA